MEIPVILKSSYLTVCRMQMICVARCEAAQLYGNLVHCPFGAYRPIDRDLMRWTAPALAVLPGIPTHTNQSYTTD